MPPPTPLSIATSSLLRLIKEERSYHQELLQQESQVEKLQRPSEQSNEGDENAAWRLGQEKRAIEETKAIFPGLRAGIEGAVGRVEGLLEDGKGDDKEEIVRAKEALAEAETRGRGGA